jgi:hypothetical protein
VRIRRGDAEVRLIESPCSEELSLRQDTRRTDQDTQCTGEVWTTSDGSGDAMRSEAWNVRQSENLG